MGKKSKRGYVAEEPFRESWASAFTRFVLTTVTAAAILYVGALLMARTDGFRSYAEEYLSERLGMPIRVWRAMADLRLRLILEKVTSENVDKPGAPSLDVRRAVVSWSLVGLFHPMRRTVQTVILEGCRVVFVADPKEGGWEPGF